MTALTRNLFRLDPKHLVVPGRRTRAPHLKEHAGSAPKGRARIGQRLVEAGLLDPGDLLKALSMQSRQEARLGDILISQRMVSEDELLDTLAEQWDACLIDLSATPPDVRLVDRVGVDTCVQDAMIPWQRRGAVTVVVTSRPEKFAAQRPRLEEALGPVIMALATEVHIHAALTALRNDVLAAKAEQRVAPMLSCRDWNPGPTGRLILSACLCFLALAISYPVAMFSLLAGWAVLTLALTLALKIATLTFAVSEARRSKEGVFQSSRAPAPKIARLPIVSIMVPLFHEEDVAGHLIKRLSRLAYPKELIDVLLVVEVDDETTTQALARTKLPRWMRVVSVPRGGVKTKPRALNYALDFCRGGIVGIWDAEDAPDPDQLYQVVRRFHERGPEVACVQGILDFYNTRTNWLSRCFTIEYAGWFRVMLPGLQKLGLALPLGGTTVFFRRAALESLGGWDAHNVTEDADLGIRLARKGYRTEMIDTVTGEEANCRTLPWIKQRSRWIKGYAMTWAVHMRQPLVLLRELGLRRFAGFQLLFLGTLSQVLLAPVLWSFWALPFGLPHPWVGVIPGAMFWTLGGVFILSELVGIAVGIIATRRAGKRDLAAWVPTLHFYFPLAALASYKAFFEILTKPFYWDKTSHGIFHEADQADPNNSDGPAQTAQTPARISVLDAAPMPKAPLIS